ncbi:TIGR03905 family TSCPD domain-containing protein [Oscillospiraceae bacterium LTW-04]|nr:TIGR03905 family TSCPD domain-containing protein [Oscillospiraceae bacterium MB24-C1]
MNYEFAPKGVCSKKILFELSDDGIIEKIKFIGGCQGNLAGISKLVVGMKALEVIERLKGTTCGFKKTSCPDQLSCALQEALDKK